MLAINSCDIVVAMCQQPRTVFRPESSVDKFDFGHHTSALLSYKLCFGLIFFLVNIIAKIILDIIF